MCCPVKGVRGAMDPKDVRAAVRVKDIHHPDTALICVENTHNYAGGAVLPIENMAAIRKAADEFGLPVHLDGARVFNAATALNVPVSAIAKYADSVSFCLSKGLSAPVGSILNGSKPFIVQARRFRKLLGGGMRQAACWRPPESSR
jgi:threonine aldolase